MAQTIADLITATLADAGVRRIWGATGGSLSATNDSLRRLGSIGHGDEALELGATNVPR